LGLCSRRDFEKIIEKVKKRNEKASQQSDSK